MTTGSCDVAGVSWPVGLEAGVLAFELEGDPENSDEMDMMMVDLGIVLLLLYEDANDAKTRRACTREILDHSRTPCQQRSGDMSSSDRKAEALLFEYTSSPGESVKRTDASMLMALSPTTGSWCSRSRQPDTPLQLPSRFIGRDISCRKYARRNLTS